MTCRTCRHLDAPVDKNGRRNTRAKWRTYECLALLPELPPLPVSVTRYYAWQWPPNRLRMAAEEGAGCPMHQPISKAKP